MEVYGHLTAAYLVMISNCNGIKFNAISMVRLLWLHFQAGVKSSGLSKQVLAHFPAKFPLIMLIRVPDNCDLSCSAC